MFDELGVLEKARQRCRLVPPGREIGDQPGRPQGAMRVGRATKGAVGDSDFLAVIAQNDGVLAGISAGAHGVNADFASGASTCPLASMPDVTVERFPVRGGNRPRERKSGAGRSVDLVAVVS